MFSSSVLTVVSKTTLLLGTALLVSSFSCCGEERTGTPLPPPETVTRVPLARDAESAMEDCRNTSALVAEGEADPDKTGYRVEVLGDPDRPKSQTPPVPLLFRWPVRKGPGEFEAKTPQLQVREVEAADAFASWASQIIVVQADDKQRLRLWDENPCVTYFLPAGPSATTVRFVRAPQEKGRRFPVEVQILQTAEHPKEALADLLKALAPGATGQRVSPTDCPLLKNLLATAPMIGKLRNVDWRLQRYGAAVTGRLRVSVNLAATLDGMPFELQTIVGPRGSIMVISGIGLEALGDPGLKEHLRNPIPTPRRVLPANRDARSSPPVTEGDE